VSVVQSAFQLFVFQLSDGTGAQGGATDGSTV
jgi:hypothetical protein